MSALLEELDEITANFAAAAMLHGENSIWEADQIVAVLYSDRF